MVSLEGMDSGRKDLGKKKKKRGGGVKSGERSKVGVELFEEYCCRRSRIEFEGKKELRRRTTSLDQLGMER